MQKLIKSLIKGVNPKYNKHLDQRLPPESRESKGLAPAFGDFPTFKQK